MKPEEIADWRNWVIGKYEELKWVFWRDHSLKAAAIACKLALQFGVDPLEAGLAALLCGIGKTDEEIMDILEKRRHEKLSPMEEGIVREFPQRGLAMIKEREKKSGSLASDPVKFAVWFGQIWYNGKEGYPLLDFKDQRGVGEIDMKMAHLTGFSFGTAAILTHVYIVEKSELEHKSYDGILRPLTLPQALEEIRRASRTQFHPDLVVAAELRMIEDYVLEKGK